MDKANGKKTSLDDETKLIWRVRRLEEQAKEHRRKFDWQWLVRSLYVRGYHYAQYNRGTNKIIFSTRTGVQIPINLVSAHLRGVRNQVTSFEPKWEVLPSVTTEHAFSNARYSGKTLDFIYEKSQIKRKIKEGVNDALMYSIGVWHFDIDRNKNIVITRVDPFDFLVDPNVKSPNINDPEYGAEYCIMTNQTSIDAIKKNKKYKGTEQVGTDNLTAAAEYKRFLLQVVRNQFATQREVNETVILKQAFIRERDDNGEFRIRILHYIDSMDKSLYNELTDDTEFPFEVLQGDIQPGELYGESWIKHLIPINRVIDSLESHIFEYNHFFAKGKWIIDKNSGVRLIVNQHGQIIEKNRGATVTPVTVPPLPPSPETQLARMRQNLEDISGVHDVCVSEDTEALTREGWKNYMELKNGKEIFTLNPQTKKGEWNEIKNLYVYQKNNEPLISIKNKNISALVTKNHRWFVKTRKVDKFKETRNLTTADQIYLTASCNPIPIQRTYDDNFIELAGWVITEGTYSQDFRDIEKGKRRIRISQSQEANPLQWNRINNLLIRMEIGNKPQLQKDKSTQFAFAGEKAKLMRNLFPTKELTPEFVSKLTREQLVLLLETMIAGDGSIERNCYYSVSKTNADLFQMVATLLGINARIDILSANRYKKISKIIRGTKKFKPLFRVNLKPFTKFTGFTSLKRFNKFVKEQLYTGVIWCPETKNSTWIMRKNGKVSVTGNSLGRLPGTIRSGVAIAELRQSDATNQSDLVDNLEDFLSRSGRRILKLVAENWNTTRLITTTGLGGKPEYFMAVGESGGVKKRKFKMGDKDLDLAVIGAENEVRVQVGSWLAYTKEARQEKLKELFRLGAIDQKTLLLMMEFGDIDGIYERSREERIFQSRTGSKSESIQREYGLQLGDEEVALAENEIMLEGTEQHAEAGDDHELHKLIHEEEKEVPLVRAHIKEHDQLAKWANKMQTTPQPQMGAVPAPVGLGSPEGIPPTGVPETFTMNPVTGAGAPPFNPNQEVIKGGPFTV